MRRCSNNFGGDALYAKQTVIESYFDYIEKHVLNDLDKTDDNKKVITRSHSKSDNSENNNDENAVIFYDNDKASDYSVGFIKLLNKNNI